MQKKLDITVIILTYNEQLHLGRCIKSVKKFVKQVIVIDSHSNDKTLEICKKYKVRIYKNKFINQAIQMNWALKNVNIQSKWIFRIDADEITDKFFFYKIKDIIINNRNISGIIIKRKIKFLNKLINYGLTSPHKTLRIWKNKKGKYQNISVDEQVEVKGKIVLCEAIIVDHNLNSFSWWLNKHRNYALREAESYFLYKKNFNNKRTHNQDYSKIRQIKKHKVYYRLPIFIRAIILFLYSYIFKLGFLSGVRGLIFYFFQTLWYRMLVDLIILKKIFK
tara:strand:+ start:598 stop:1431 length:834 start_codon:yes stop_codon:yes gene_type:complete